MKKTPFWPVVESLLLPDFKSFWCRCYNKIVTHIVRVYSRKKNAFKIGDNYIKLRPIDVRLIFGIECGDKIISPKNFIRAKEKDNDFYKRRCATIGVKRLDYPSLCNMLEKATSGKTTTDIQDVARIITLIMLAKLFIPNQGYAIGWSYLRFIDDLDRLKSYVGLH